jgi:hypothetical protein
VECCHKLQKEGASQNPLHSSCFKSDSFVHLDSVKLNRILKHILRVIFVQIYVPPSLDQRFVATCVQEGDGLRCNTTVRLYSRRYLGNRDDGTLSPRLRGADDKDAEESRPLQDVRIKTDVRRGESREDGL